MKNYKIVLLFLLILFTTSSAAAGVNVTKSPTVCTEYYSWPCNKAYSDNAQYAQSGSGDYNWMNLSSFGTFNQSTINSVHVGINGVIYSGTGATWKIDWGNGWMNETNIPTMESDATAEWDITGVTSWTFDKLNKVKVNITCTNCGLGGVSTYVYIDWVYVRANLTFTPAQSISNLQDTSHDSWINWTWTDPQDTAFDKVMVYIDGIFKSNVTRGTQYYNATSLSSTIGHTISTRTVSWDGVINQTWVNNTGGTKFTLTSITNSTYAMNYAYTSHSLTNLTFSVIPKSTRSDPYDIPKNGLVGYWRSDETSGTNLIDQSNTSNNGTLNGGYTRVIGKYGTSASYGAVQYDGLSGTYANVPHNFAYYMGGGSWTLIVLFKNLDLSQTGTIIAKDGSAGSQRQFGLEFPAQNPGKLRITTFGGDSIWLFGDTQQTVISDNNWHWIEAGYNTSRSGNSSLYLKVDDVEQQLNYNQVGWMGTMQNGNAPLRFAARTYSGYEDETNIVIDSVLLYNRSISEIEKTNIIYDSVHTRSKIHTNITWSLWSNHSSTAFKIPYGGTDIFNKVIFEVPTQLTQNNIIISEYVPVFNVSITPQINESIFLRNYNFSNWLHDFNYDLSIGSYNNNEIVDLGALISPKISKNDKSNPYDMSLNGVIGMYRFENNISVIDYSYLKNNGTTNGSSGIVDGKYSNSIRLYGGLGSQINIPHKNEYNFNRSNFTFFILFKLHNISTKAQIFSKDSDVTGRSWDIQYNSNNFKEISFAFFSSAGWIQYYNISNWAPDTNWHWIEVGRVGDSAYMRIDEVNSYQLYFNNSFDWKLQNSTASITIGGRNYTGYEDNGEISIDMVYIFNRTVNDTDRLILYDSAEQIRGKLNSNSSYNIWNETDTILSFPRTSEGLINTASFWVPKNITQDNITIRDYSPYVYTVVAVASQNITSVDFVSPPTVIDAHESWNKNWTTIEVQSTKSISNITLFWQPYRVGIPKPLQTYWMDMNGTLSANITLFNLIDGYYDYWIRVNYTDGDTFISTVKWLRIDLSFGYDHTNKVFLFIKNDDGQYVSYPNVNVDINATLIEPEFSGLNHDTPGNETAANQTLLRRCYNTSTGIYRDDNIACSGGEQSTDLIYVLNQYNIHTIPIIRYRNSSGYYVTIADSNIPYEYTFDKLLGYGMRTIKHKDDIVYISNSQISAGFDKKFAGAGVYLASVVNLSKNYVDNFDSGRQLQVAYLGNYTQSNYGYLWYNWNFNPTHAGNKYSENSSLVQYENTSSYATFEGWLVDWNTDNGGEQNSTMWVRLNWSLDENNPVLILKSNYSYYGYRNHSISKDPGVRDCYDVSNSGIYCKDSQEPGASYLIQNFSKMVYYNDSGYTTIPHIGEVPYYWTELAYFGAAVDDSNFGVGVWRKGLNYYRTLNWTNTSEQSEFSLGTAYFSPEPIQGIIKQPEGGYTTDEVRWYVGYLDDMKNYFLILNGNSTELNIPSGTWVYLTNIGNNSTMSQLYSVFDQPYYMLRIEPGNGTEGYHHTRWIKYADSIVNTGNGVAARYTNPTTIQVQSRITPINITLPVGISWIGHSGYGCNNCNQTLAWYNSTINQNLISIEYKNPWNQTYYKFVPGQIDNSTVEVPLGFAVEINMSAQTEVTGL